jgi:phage-related protein/methyl-accepting chemotaxis protein
MELERLEVVFDGDLTPFEEKMNQFASKLDGIMGRVQRSSSEGVGGVEKNLSSDAGFSKFNQNIEKLNQNLEKTFARMEQTAKSNSSRIGSSLSSGVSKGTAKMTKDVEDAVSKINIKMQQAQAAQQRLANLQSDRSGAQISGDGKATSRYDEQITKAQIAMNKYQSEAQTMVRALKNEYDAIPASLSNISTKMEQNEQQIEKMRSKVKALNQEIKSQRQPIGNFDSGTWKQTGTKETKASIKTANEIDKQSAKMNKMIAENDRLQQAYASLEDHSGKLKSALGNVNTELGKTATKSKMATNGMNNLSGNTKKTEGVFSRLKGVISSSVGNLGNIFRRQSSSVSSSTNQMSNGLSGFSRRLTSIVKQVFVFGLIYRSLRLLSTGLFGALKTNAQFAASLNQIKVNLLTAFYPIYQAILPAINALMSALAAATGYIAAFISTLFGVDISSAFSGANGLMDATQALNDTGSAASDASDEYDEMADSIRESNKEMKKQHDKSEKARKAAEKLKRALMGFDEINVLGLDTNEFEKEEFVPQEIPKKPKNSGGSSPWANFGSASIPDTPKWLTDFAKKFQDVLSKLFDPIKKAWDIQGKKVIDAFKYALSEVIGLVQAIGRSFMDVWTNGTGQRFVENLLILLADVLNIVGDIAGAFKRAWEDNGRGTALIQSFFDMFNAILELLHAIATAFRDAWNDNGLGQSIAVNILEILTNVNNIIGNLANQFKKAWNEGGKGESIFKTILKMVDGVLGNINNITKATADWARTLDFTPLLSSIDGLLKSIEPLTKNIGDGLEWFYKNVLLPLASFTIEDLIPAFLNALAGAIDLVNGVIEGLKPAAEFLWNSFLKPLAEWTGGVIVDILNGIGSGLSKIGQWISEHSEGFSNFVLVVGTFAATLKAISILTTIGSVLSSVFSLLTSIGGLSGVLSTVSSVLGALITALGGPIVLALAAAGGAFVLAYKNCEPFREFINNLLSDIKNFAEKIYNEYIKPALDEVVRAFQSALQKIKEFWDKYGEDFFTACRNALNLIWNFVKPWLELFWKQFKTTFETVANLIKVAWDLIKNIFDGAFQVIGGVIKIFIGVFTGDFDTALEGVKDVFSGAWKIISSGFEAFIDGMAVIAKGIGNAIINPIESAVNGVIGGVNWVLSAVGSDWKVPKWDAPKFYARGTNYHPGGPAVVNDGSGSNWQEMYRLPNGQVGAFPRKKNLMVNLPRGTQVLPGDLSAQMLPYYSGGIFDTFRDFFKNGFDRAKGIADDVWNVISNPGALVDMALDKFANFTGIIEPMDSIVDGILSTSRTAIVNMVVDFINGFTGFANGGLVDQFGLYQLAEGNEPEMVIPLSKPQLAFERMTEALDYMGFDLSMPEVLQSADPGSCSGGTIQHSNRGKGNYNGRTSIDDLTAAIVAAIQNGQMSTTGEGKQTINVTVELEKEPIGRASVEYVNEQIEKTNTMPFDL